MSLFSHRVSRISVLGLFAGIGIFSAFPVRAEVSISEVETDPAAPAVDGSAPQPGVRAVAWEEFRARCEHPEQFDVQRAPQNIRVQCMDRRLNWVASAPGDVTLPTGRRVSAGIISDKFSVERTDHELAQKAKSGSCQRFKEVEEVFSVERPVGCSDILAVKGDVGEFCEQILDSSKVANPKWVERHDTARVLDTCATAAIEVRGDGHGL